MGIWDPVVFDALRLGDQVTGKHIFLGKTCIYQVLGGKLYGAPDGAKAMKRVVGNPPTFARCDNERPVLFYFLGSGRKLGNIKTDPKIKACWKNKSIANF